MRAGRLRWGASAAASLVALVGACDSFSTENATAGDAGDASTEASTDTSTDRSSVSDSASADSSVEAGANTVFSDFFENPLDCGGWVAAYTKLTHADTARTGTGACRMCLIESGTGFMRRSVNGAGPGTYQVEAWTRVDTSADAGLPYVNFAANAVDAGRLTPLPQSVAEAQTTTWKRTSASYSFAEDIESAEISVLIGGQKGDCVLIDDVAFLHVPP